MSFYLRNFIMVMYPRSKHPQLLNRYIYLMHATNATFWYTRQIPPRRSVRRYNESLKCQLLWLSLTNGTICIQNGSVIANSLGTSQWSLCPFPGSSFYLEGVVTLDLLDNTVPHKIWYALHGEKMSVTSSPSDTMHQTVSIYHRSIIIQPSTEHFHGST